MAAEIVSFPRRPIGPEAVRHASNEPCLVLILPVVRIEREESPAERLTRFLNRVLECYPRT